MANGREAFSEASEMDRSPSFARQLRQYREAAGLSQEELAERAGLTAGAVGALERGQRRHPYLHTVRVLAEALELSADERAALIGAIPERRSTVTPLAEQPAASLPTPSTPIVGRTRELAEVRELLAGTGPRLLTLTGSGGVGKTRLAIQVATEIAKDYRDGAAFVSFAPLLDPALVIPAVCQAFGLQQAAGHSAIDALRSYLRAKALLLVLDNFEHLLPAASELADLLAACGEVTLLVTSRAPLHLIGEQEYPVPPLALPELSRTSAFDDAATSAAVQLFVQRAREVSPAFALTPANAMAVAAICRRLDGLPLAIELAAAWIKLLPPTALLARLDRRLPLLSGGPRDAPERQQTIRATVGWSHDLLTAAEKDLFRRLSVFVGGFDLEAAEAVVTAAGGLELSVLQGVATLVDKSLLHREDVPSNDIAAGPRFRMLETVREFALEQLEANRQAEATRRAHADTILELAECAELQLQGFDASIWVARLEAEHDNIRAALAWGIERNEAERCQRLVGALHWFWFIRHSVEGLGWTERALAVPGDAAPGVRAKALYTAGVLTWWVRADDERAMPQTEASFAIWRHLGDMRGMALALHHLGRLAWLAGDLDRTITTSKQGLRLVDEADDPALVASFLMSLAIVARERGDPERAWMLAEEALGHFRTVGFRWAVAWAVGFLADLARRRGANAEATALYHESIVLYRAEGNAWAIAEALRAAAMMAAADRQREAARLFGASEALHEAVGVQAPPASRQSYERAVGELRKTLGEVTFSAEWAAGRALSTDQAVDEAASLAAALASEQPASALSDARATPHSAR